MILCGDSGYIEIHSCEFLGGAVVSVVVKNWGNITLNSSRLRIWYFAAFVAGSGSEGSSRWTAVQPRA